MGQHFAYNKKGYAAYKKAKRKRPSKRNYSDRAIMMARRNYG